MSGNAKRKRRSFSDEFKHSAVELIVKQDYSFRAAADAVDVDETTLRDWHRRLAPATEPSSETATLQELTEENKRPRKLLQRAEMEREILKKSNGVLREGVTVKYAWIKTNKAPFSDKS